ncbi:MAG: DUF1801 domain-containing protein [Pseudomonadota bacterium]
MNNDLKGKLRNLIGEVAQETDSVGEIEETLKWGQPSFAPKRPKVGSSVRLQDNEDGSTGLMFICNTDLVERFRTQYPDQLDFIGNREIRVRELTAANEPALKHCVAMALTYHLSKRASKQ